MTKSCGQKCTCYCDHEHHNHGKHNEHGPGQVGETLILDGFQCRDCAEKVQEKLAALKGVAQVELNSRRAEMELEYDSSLIDRDQILELVEDQGYRCEVHAATSQYSKTDFRLEGLDCADCAAKLEHRVQSLAGVKKATVNFGASKMTVEHSIPRENIIKTVKQMGYDASPEEKMQREQMDTFRLEGLDCADCAAKLEKSIQQLPGVREARVNFGASKMTVEHATSTDKILKAVGHAGYSAGLESSGAGARNSTFRLSGLDCADCAGKLEKRLASTPGVESVKVNFGAAKMDIKHTAGVEEITRVTEEAGYGAELAGNESTSPKQEKPFYKDIKTILTGISGLFIAAGFLVSLLNLPGEVVTGLFLGAIVTGGLFIARSAFYSLKSLSLDMNVLMSAAVIGAAAIGEWGEGAMVVFLFSVGNVLQAYSMEKTRNSIRELMELSPREALVRRNGREITLPVEEISVGDIIIVKPGERIAMDGKIVTGTSMVNQAPITGESMPVEKTPGAEAFAGTVNEEGSLEIEVTRLVQDTTLARIIDMVEEAQSQRAPSQQFVDVFAKYYTPAVIGIAVAIAAIPPLAMGLPFVHWLEKALILLVIACPCALVISTPVSIVSAIGSAAKRGVLIKGGAYLEEAGALQAIAFDKTGTLTEGRPAVTDVINLNSTGEQEVLSIAAAVEKRSQHPLAQAITRRAGQEGIEPPASEDFQSVTGKGAGTVINGQRYYVGNTRLFEDLQVKNLPSLPGELQKEGKTAMLVGTGDEIYGVIAVADRPRPGSAPTIQALKKAGAGKTVMLTGDHAVTARAVAAQLGIDDFRAELLPEDKLGTIKELQAEHGKVAMVGDGVNDAPALATANVGIAMGGAGTDTALETADIALMADDLSKLPYAIHLSKRALRVIKQNIAFALLVKAVFIAGTFMDITTLWMAVFADTGASLIVILNGMRLMRVKEKERSVI